MDSLHPPETEKYRRLPWSLAHIALNNFFFTWTFGSAIFLLFLDELGLPKDQIGMLLSFFPFTGMLALGFGSLVAKWGRKRIYILGYGIRKPVMASLLLLPWLLVAAGRQAALVFLFAVILTVAVLRALAETGFIPWFQEFVPNAVRGKYASVNNILVTLTSGLALWIASRVIANNTGITGYMTLIGLGAAIGLVGVFMMLPVPGGKPIPEAGSTRAHASNLRKCLSDRNFRSYMGGMGSFILGSVMLGSFLPLFVKEQVGVPSQTVVILEVAAMLGSALSSLLAGVLSDRLGSRPVMMPGLVLTVSLPIGWLIFSALLQPTAAGSGVLGSPPAWILAACGLLYFLGGGFTTIASIGASRLLYNNVIPVEQSTAYSSMYYAWAGFMGGLTPILAGRLLASLSGWSTSIGAFPFDGYRLLFSLSILGFASAVFFYRRVRPD